MPCRGPLTTSSWKATPAKREGATSGVPGSEQSCSQTYPPLLQRPSSRHDPELRGRPPLLLEVGVSQGLVGSDSLIRIIGHHCVQEGEALWGQTGCQ